jgi:recombination protein RecT
MTDNQHEDIPVHTSQSIAKRPGQGDVKDMVWSEIKKRHETIKRLVSDQLDPAKFALVAMTTVRNNEKLLQCTPQSLVTAIIMAAQRGLSLDPTLGHAYLVPYWNRDALGKGRGAFEAQYQTGYQGKIHLAKRDGDVVIDSFIVYENDHFEITRTSSGYDFEHKPTPLNKDPGDAVGYVARALLPDGRTLFEVMRKADVEKIRQSVKARFKKDTPAWAEWYDEQARGKAINRLAKYLPQSPLLQFDARQEDALQGGDAKVIDIESEDGTLLPMVVPQQIVERAEAAADAAGQGAGKTAIRSQSEDAQQEAAERPTAAVDDPPTKDRGQVEDGTQEPAGAASKPISAKAAFGAYVRRLRTDAGITQAQLGQGVGVSDKAVGKLERGESMPNSDLVLAVARFLSVHPDDLLAVAGFKPASEHEERQVAGESEPPTDMAAKMRENDDDQGNLGV